MKSQAPSSRGGAGRQPEPHQAGVVMIAPEVGAVRCQLREAIDARPCHGGYDQLVSTRDLVAAVISEDCG